MALLQLDGVHVGKGSPFFCQHRRRRARRTAPGGVHGRRKPTIAHGPCTFKYKPDLKCKLILNDLMPCNCTVPGGSAVTTAAATKHQPELFLARRVYGRVPGPLSPQHQ